LVAGYRKRGGFYNFPFGFQFVIYREPKLGFLVGDGAHKTEASSKKGTAQTWVTKNFGMVFLPLAIAFLLQTGR
jgi:hypothetical protein